MFDFYKKHSFFTDPGVMSEHFNDLPDSVSDLVKITQELLIHRADAQLFDLNFSEERLEEVNIRKVSHMINKILALNPMPLIKKRFPEQRLITTCRGFAVLLCSFLRYKGFSARVRVGFVNYLWGGSMQDHYITEYWNPNKNRWIKVDARITPTYIARVPKAKNLNILDVEKAYYETAQEVWRQCRAAKTDPNQYVYGLFRKIRGLRHIQDRLIADLACLNKMELHAWDLWGYMIWDLPGIAPHELAHLALLDQLASLDTQEEIEKIKAIYQHPQLKLSSPILSSSPFHPQEHFTLEEILNAA